MLDPVVAEYYGGTDYHNFGYWDADTRDQGQASENLIRKLLEPIRENQGRILDVACGLGASTRYLEKLYPSDNIVAVNLSSVQLNYARSHLPAIQFVQVDAAHLPLDSHSFDAILCVEAAFHFDSRDLFLHEAFRVLRPGGQIVFSDVTGPMPSRDYARKAHLPTANYLADGNALKTRIERAGFQSVQVTDATAQCWYGFRDYMRRLPGIRRRSGTTTLGKYLGETMAAWYISLRFSKHVRRYYLCSAQRLSGNSPRQLAVSRGIGVR